MRGYRAASHGVGWEDVPHIPFYKYFEGKWEVDNGRSRERLCEGSDFKEVPQCLKSNRISLADGLTSNKEQTYQ